MLLFDPYHTIHFNSVERLLRHEITNKWRVFVSPPVGAPMIAVCSVPDEDPLHSGDVQGGGEQHPAV